MVGHLLPSFIRSEGPAWPWSWRGPGLLTGQKALPPPPVRHSALVRLPRCRFQATKTDPDTAARFRETPCGRTSGQRAGGGRHPIWQRVSPGRGPGSSLWKECAPSPGSGGIDGKHGPGQFGKPVSRKCSPASRCSVPPLVLRTGTPGQDRPSEALAAGPPLGSLKAGPHP